MRTKKEKAALAPTCYDGADLIAWIEEMSKDFKTLILARDKLPYEYTNVFINGEKVVCNDDITTWAATALMDKYGIQILIQTSDRKKDLYTPTHKIVDKTLYKIERPSKAWVDRGMGREPEPPELDMVDYDYDNYY